MARADNEAERLLSELGITSAPVDPFSIADALGVLVVVQDLEPDVSGMLIRDGRERTIGVNQRHALTRRRFTVGHELGHLRLHRGRELILDTAIRVDFRDPISSLATDREEIEANGFAAALLMPAQQVLDEASSRSFADPDDFVRRLARHFKVSEAAMSYRLMNLGLLS